MIFDPRLFWVLHSYIGIGEQFCRERSSLKSSKSFLRGAGVVSRKDELGLCAGQKGAGRTALARLWVSCLQPRHITNPVGYVSLRVKKCAESSRECYYALSGGLLSLLLLMNVW